MEQPYNTTKKLTGKCYKPERSAKDKEGLSTPEIRKQRNRWVEHFEKLLDRPAPLNPQHIEAAQKDLPIDIIPLTVE